jgi:SOS response regulatory protein OraA/RecX
MSEITAESLIRFLKDKAYTILTRRDHCEVEIRKKLHLALKKYADNASLSIDDLPPAIDAVVEELHRQHLLDDEKFARQWIASRTAFRPRSKIVLSQELRQKGVDQALIKTLLDELLSKDSEVESARKLLAKRTRKTEEQNIRYLAGKGFSFAIIRQALLPPDKDD